MSAGGSPWDLDGLFAGYSRDDLRRWVARRADGQGRVDLQRAGLPEPFSIAWKPEKLDWHIGPDSYIAFPQGDDEHMEMVFNAQLLTPRGGHGQLRRRFDTRDGRVVHARFTLPDEDWGSGHGKRTMRRSVQLYRAVELAEVTVLAAALGRYVWPNCGFQSADTEVQALTVEAVRALGDALGIAYLGDEDFEQLWDYTELNYNDDETRNTVSRGQLERALASLGMRWEDCEVEPNDETLLGAALLIWNPGNAADPMPLWPGLLSLDDGNLQSVRQLDDYTETCR